MDNPTPENVDNVVNYLLREQDYLLAQEIKHKVEELNQLLISAHSHGMKVEFVTKELIMPSGGSVQLADARVYKKI